MCVRDISVLEGMMAQHQSLKIKMDNKSKNFVHCVEMGKMLLAARNPAAEEVYTCLNQSYWPTFTRGVSVNPRAIVIVTTANHAVFDHLPKVI